MRVLVAPQELKGTLTASEAADALAEGIRRVRPDVELDVVPIADGGPGTLDAWLTATKAQRMRAEVSDPLGRRVWAEWGLARDGQTALVEMAQASGLWRLAEHERDPSRANTAGTGELILLALESGAKSVIISHGGSGTVDGGMGALRALGVRFLDSSGRETTQASEVVRVDVSSSRVRGAALLAAVDVTAPLLGERGAARLFGPQKGATAAQVRVLEEGLQRLAGAAPHVDSQAPGLGAAGGLAFGLFAFAGAHVAPGFELLFSALQLKERIAAADVVLTAEGKLDSQSALGKGPVALARRAHEQGRRVVGFVGTVGDGAPRECFDELIVAPGNDTPSARESLIQAASAWMKRQP